MINTNLKIINTPKKGKGVITSVDVPSRTVIFEFKGDKFDRSNLVHDEAHILQIGQSKFLGPSGDIDDYINHSCNPNCGLIIVGARAFLLSLYKIVANTEITFDYSTSSNDTLDEWKMNCECGDFKCRKIISGFQYLENNIKEYYKKLGVVPTYLFNK